MDDKVQVVTEKEDLHSVSIEGKIFLVENKIVSIPKNLLKKFEDLGFRLYSKIEQDLKEEENKLKADLEKVKEKLTFKKK